MALLTQQNGTNGLADVVMSAAAGGGDTAVLGTRVAGHDLSSVLIVRNADTTSTTVTVDGVGYVVPANTGTAIIPIFGVPSTIFAGIPLKNITYSKVTALTVASVRLAPTP